MLIAEPMNVRRQLGFAAVNTFANGFIEMSRQSKPQTESHQAEDEQRRDALLFKLLKTSPQPRPKRERDKSVPPKRRPDEKADAIKGRAKPTRASAKK